MQTIQEIEQAISRLSREELARLREWFDEFDAAMWDRQFESDVRSGKLEQLAEKAIADYRAGKSKEI
jgi:hypothetical protein